jgi:hypothetical protein
MHSLIGVRQRTEREPELLRNGPGFVLYALMDAVVDRYFPVIDALETDLESIEDQIFEPHLGRANIERLYALKRKIGVVKHAVAPLQEAVAKLISGRVPQVCSNNREYFRDVFDHLTRMNASLDALRDTIGTAIQVNLSTVTIEETEITKRLAAWAGIFAVATAFAGIWGMNFQNMPELKVAWGYPAALAVIAVTCGFTWWRFRRAIWLGDRPGAYAGVVRLPRGCPVECRRGAYERLEGFLVDLVALVQIDGAPGVAFEAGIEQPRRVLERSALGESQLHDALVCLAGADDAVVRPDRNAPPLPLLDHRRVGLSDEGAHPRERLAAPVAQLPDPRVDQPGRGFAPGRGALLHVVFTSLGWPSLIVDKTVSRLCG